MDSIGLSRGLSKSHKGPYTFFQASCAAQDLHRFGLQ